jgi:AraC-like DNA-binding protein
MIRSLLLFTTSENILWLISGLGILQGFLLALLLYFHPRSDKTVNKFLALYIFFLSMILMMPFMIRAVSWQNSVFLQPIPLLTGPFLYLYLRSFKETITWRKAFPHFILFFLFYIPTYWNVIEMASRFPDAKEVPAGVLKNPPTIIINYIKFIQGIVYYLLARKTLKTYQRSIKQLFSETSRINLNWAKLLTNGFLLIILSAIAMFSLMLRFPEYFTLLLVANMALATPYIYLATYKGIMQPTIWQIQPSLPKEIVEEEMHEAEEVEIQATSSEKIKTPKTGLNEDKIDEIVQRIITLMDKEKLYQESELTLQQLAGKLQQPTYLVSQAINEGTKRNFYELINGYRVEEAKRLLLDPKSRNYTILSVAFEAGFNSKTTFNTVFKKFTGLTPTDFREKRQEPELAT